MNRDGPGDERNATQVSDRRCGLSGSSGQTAREEFEVPEHQKDYESSTSVSRRGMLRGAAIGAGVVAAGTGAALTAGAGPAGATPLASGAGHDQIVAHVRNVATGEVEVFVGDRQVTIYDREVAVRLANAAR